KSQYDETYLVNVIKSLSIGKDLLLVCNDEHYNLIQWCVLHNYLQALELLLKYGCNPNRGSLLPSQTSTSKTVDLPLALACCFQRTDAARLLLSYGGNSKQSTTLSQYTLRRMAKVKKLHYLQILDLLHKQHRQQHSLTPLNIVFVFDDLEMFKIIFGKTQSASSSITSMSTELNHNSNNNFDEMLTSFQPTDEITKKVLAENVENENDVYSDTVTPQYDNYLDDDDSDEIQEKQETHEELLSDEKEFENKQPLVFSKYLQMNNRKLEKDILETLQFSTDSSINTYDAPRTWSLRIQNEQSLLQKSQQQQPSIEVPIGKSEKSIFTVKNGERTTTDGGYHTISPADGSVEDGGDCTNKTTTTPLETDTNHGSLTFHLFEDSRTISLCSTVGESNNQIFHRKTNKQLSRTKSQEIVTNVIVPTTGRLSLQDTLKSKPDSPIMSCSSSTSSLMSLSNPNRSPLFHRKTSTKMYRLIQKMIDSESEHILKYFLKQYEEELQNNQQQQFKTSFDLLANVKSERIYNVLTCYSFKTTNCDKNNNTLLHLLFKNKPNDFESKQMKIITERYLTSGLKEFLNRPNLSNEYIIQILLENEYFIDILFFSQTKKFEIESGHHHHHHSVNCTNNRHTNIHYYHYQQDGLCNHNSYDLDSIQEWRETYLTLIELLIDNGSRIDMPTGKYQNTIDCLLSAIINCIQQKHQHHTYSSNQFDIKYLKKLLTTLFHMNLTPTNHLKYTIERFLQLICHIHITNDELNDTFDIFYLLCQYEYQPLKLNMITIVHLLKSWLINPNFLCSNLTEKCLFIQQLLVTIIRFPTEEQITEDLFINSRKLSISTITEFRKNTLLFHILNLIPYAQTCVQIDFIYELILSLIYHGLDPNNFDERDDNGSNLPIVVLCLLKVNNKMLTKRLLPFIDLFFITLSSIAIDKAMVILRKKMTTVTIELYQYLEMLMVKPRTLKQMSIRCIYTKCKKPFLDSIQLLPLDETLKHRLIRL
ncbi:unnamed protein product, partial [Didymodactylos carnosus]